MSMPTNHMGLTYMDGVRAGKERALKEMTNKYTEDDLKDAFNAGEQHCLMTETGFPKNAPSFEEFLKAKNKQ